MSDLSVLQVTNKILKLLERLPEHEQRRVLLALHQLLGPGDRPTPDDA